VQAGDVQVLGGQKAAVIGPSRKPMEKAEAIQPKLRARRSGGVMSAT